MKRLLALSALVSVFATSQAQEVQTYSVYDTDQSGTINVGDAVGVANQVVQNVASDKTPQYVTAEDLSVVLEKIESRLAQLERMQRAVVTASGAVVPNESHNNHDYVDLGLTDANGKPVYWATCNVGATAPEDYGLYFAWGATGGYSSNPADGHLFNWANAPFNGGNSTYSASAWNAAKSEAVNTSTHNLLPANDAARATWGGKWRMPTSAEIMALCDQCTWTYTTQNSVVGYNVMGPNGNSIFIPGTGYRDGDKICRSTYFVFFWSGTYSSGYEDDAYFLYCGSGGPTRPNCDRCFGLTVRPVYQK